MNTPISIHWEDEVGTFASEPPSFTGEGETVRFERDGVEPIGDTPSGSTIPGFLPPRRKR
jgi:hypothetical protein